MSEQKIKDVYQAISGAITDLRIKLTRCARSSLPSEIADIDNELFELEIEIWQRVEQALNIEYKK